MIVRTALLAASLLLGRAEAPACVAPGLIQRVVRADAARMRACYEAGLARDPALGGRVTVRFVVAPSGRVASAVRHEPTTLPDARVVACVVGAFAALRFPPGERAFTIVYPLEFVPPPATDDA